MPMISWGTTKYYPGGHGTFIGLINSFVHIIMYAYYLLSALGPQMQKYLWWKKYITNMQMVSFVFHAIHEAHINNLVNSFNRSSSAWRSFIRCNFSSLIAVFQGGRCALLCQMPSSSTSCSTISIRNLIKKRRNQFPKKSLMKITTTTMIPLSKITIRSRFLNRKKSCKQFYLCIYIS